MPQSPQDLRSWLDDLIETSRGAMEAEGSGASGRKRAARVVVAALSPVLFDEVIGRNKGKLGNANRYTGRLYYLRAAALWLTGQRDAAKGAYAAAQRLFGACPEKELCDGEMND